MKLKVCVCLALVGAVVLVSQAVAAPNFTPFLSVDINGGNSPGGPTQSGFTGWAVLQGGLTPWALSGGTTGITLAVGPYSVNMKGIAPSSGRDSRDRGANAGASSDLHRDFAFANRGVNGFGQHFIRLEITGLLANSIYEFTMYNREPFNGSLKDNPDPNNPADNVGTGVCSNCSSWQAWSDDETLGVDGPGAWMDANVGVGALYQPTWTADPNSPTNGVYKNPMPTKARVRVSGPDSADPYFFSGSFYTRSDAAGVVRVYGWADPQGYSGTQTVSLLNGFELGIIPEPGTMALAMFGLAGIAGIRRRL